VRERIEAAAVRSGRLGRDVALVAVTKSVAPEVAADLLRLGQRDLGESRSDELERKDRSLRGSGLEPRWHFIGHLQRNKVGKVVARADSIHSIDSLPLLEAVDRAAGELGLRREIWIQIKLAPETAKTGLAPDAAPEVLERALALENVALAGLMTLAPLLPAGSREVEPAARRAFRDLKRLAGDLARASSMGDALPLRRSGGRRSGRLATSMGMSGDFEWAIEEGSDLVRIGSLLFAGCPGAQGTPR